MRSKIHMFGPKIRDYPSDDHLIDLTLKGATVGSLARKVALSLMIGNPTLSQFSEFATFSAAAFLAIVYFWCRASRSLDFAVKEALSLFDRDHQRSIKQVDASVALMVACEAASLSQPAFRHVLLLTEALPASASLDETEFRIMFKELVEGELSTQRIAFHFGIKYGVCPVIVFSLLDLLSSQARSSWTHFMEQSIFGTHTLQEVSAAVLSVALASILPHIASSSLRSLLDQKESSISRSWNEVVQRKTEEHRLAVLQSPTPSTPQKAPDALVSTEDKEAVIRCANEMMRRFGVDLKTALRFSRARQGDISKAATFLSSDLAWRLEVKPENVRLSQCMKAVPSGSMRTLGMTPAGYVVIFVHVGLWAPDKYDMDEYQRSILYFLEACTRMSERFIVVFDLAKWRYSHALHMRKIARLFSILQGHYPERLQAAVLIRTPTIFASAWGIIKGFLDPATANKVTFAGHSPVEEKRALTDAGAWGVMPVSYGGPISTTIPCPNLPGEAVLDTPPLVP